MIPRIILVFLVAPAVVRGLPQQGQGGNGDLDSLLDCVFGSNRAVCNPNNPDPPASTPPPKVPRQNPEDNEDCTCVSYYLCPNGTINTDGTGFLDIRANQGACEKYMDTCCPNPLDENQPIKPKPLRRAGCGQRHADGVGFRITGATNNEAQFGEFPWMVALLRKTVLDDGAELMVYQCGGALIHERLVLTAAHCVTSHTDGELIARVGEWDTQTNKEIYPHQNVKVGKVIVNPGFKSGNLHNDFALLLLEAPVTFQDNVDTICLPPQANYVPLSTECYATGWGKDKFGEKGAYQTILKKIDLPIVPKEQCVQLLRKTRLGPFYKLHDSFVCAGGIVGKDTCKGDGGSPLACPIEGKPGTYEVTGLVAWGIGCGDETPGVYAGVAYARPWIIREAQNLGIQLES